jgi:hypothetical protein
MGQMPYDFSFKIIYALVQTLRDTDKQNSIGDCFSMIHRNIRLCSSIFFTILLVLLLAACSVGGANTASVPLPTPSPSIHVPTLSPTAASLWKVYTNQYTKTVGYTLRYQSAWQVQPENLFVSFSDPNTLSAFSVSPNADPDFGYKRSLTDAAIAQGLATSYLQLFNATATNTKDVKMAKTITVHGVAWAQVGETADVSVQGQVVNEETVIMANHNDQQQLGYVLQFTSSTRLFNASKSSYFQYMVQSFAYTN